MSLPKVHVVVEVWAGNPKYGLPNGLVVGSRIQHALDAEFSKDVDVEPRIRVRVIKVEEK